MLKSTLTTAAIAGAAMMTLSMAPAAAFTLAGPTLTQPLASAQIDHVWYDRWGVWHAGGYRYGYPGYGYGYRPAYGYHYGYRCVRGYYGRVRC
jgi:hypothetical protein